MMSEVPNVAAKKGSFLNRKVLGVPVLYLLLGFVVILAVLAFKMKPATPAAADPAAAPDAAPEAAGDTIRSESAQTYPPMPLGTVTTVQTGPAPDTSQDTALSTNDQWLAKGTMFLAGRGVSPGEAQLALSQYLDGIELTYQQGQWRDDAIRELGVPPFPVNIGATKADVARMQGPLPRSHMVKNVNEDSAAELARLYYNRTDAFAVKAIADVNGGRTSFNTGDTVNVPILPVPVIAPKPVVVPPAKPITKPIAKPAPAKPVAKPPRYYVVKRGDTLSGISLRYYGSASSSKYNIIAKANRISNPNRILAGQRLLIPYI